jgi:hypothetical protein
MPVLAETYLKPQSRIGSAFFCGFLGSSQRTYDGAAQGNGLTFDLLLRAGAGVSLLHGPTRFGAELVTDRLFPVAPRKPFDRYSPKAGA